MFQTTDSQLKTACVEFWYRYYRSMVALHARLGRSMHQPIKDRNLATTDARHIDAFERFWGDQLATALNVPKSEVGPRRIEFRDYRSKKFDVCWPLAGEPRILISIKSMQNAYRNLTNRIEEALGDSAVLRLYRVPAAFGFFFFMLDGHVPRGLTEQGRAAVAKEQSGKARGMAPYLDLIEEGGDFFSLSRLAKYRKAEIAQSRGRQDVLSQAESSLLDLYSGETTRGGGIHYDAIALVPTRVKRTKPKPAKTGHWSVAFSPVDERLDFHNFVQRLLDVAKFRGLI